MEITITNQGELPQGRVIDSGIVIVQGNAEIHCMIAPEVNIVFCFMSEDQLGSRISSSIQDAKTLRVTLINFGGATSTASSNSIPLRIGTFRGQNLFANFTCQYIGTAARYTRVFAYTFFVTNMDENPTVRNS